MIGTVNEKRVRIRNLNFRLIIYVLALTLIGILVVHSATASDTTTSIFSATIKQILGAGVGILLMILFISLDYRRLVKYSWIFFLASIISLVYVRWGCEAIYGAHRWIYIKLFGTVQPSEFVKPALLLALAFTVIKLKDRISKIYSILIYFAVCLPIFVLVLIEPDLSTTIVLILIALSVLFISNISYKWVLGVIIALIPLIIFFMIAVYQPGQPILYKIFHEHQVERINAYFFPDQYPAKTYQQQNSVMAIGSGGLFGKGLNTDALDSVKNGNYLSEENCDFIFAVVGEELGFVGSLLIIVLIGLVVFECLRIAAKCQDMAGKVIAGGTGAAIGFQSIINIAVATWMIPNTGIPLPFISAGLSSLISTYIMIGLVLSVSLWGGTRKRVYY